jgi:hypothetical protein
MINGIIDKIIMFIKRKRLIIIPFIICLCFIFYKMFIILGILINSNNNIWNLNIIIIFILLAAIAFIIQLLFNIFLETSCSHAKLIKKTNIILLSIKFSIVLFSISMIIEITLLILTYKLKILGLEDIIGFITFNSILLYGFICITNILLVYFKILWRYILNMSNYG